MNRNRILIIGRIFPSFSGTSVALNALLKSELIGKYYIVKQINIFRNKVSPYIKIGRPQLQKMLKDSQCIFKFLLYLASTRLALIYIAIAQTKWGYFRDSIFIMLSKIFKKKCIIHLHGGYFRKLYENSCKPFQWLVQFTLRQVDCAIVLSESLKSIFEGLIDKNKIEIISNFVDYYLFPSPIDIEKKIKTAQNRQNNSLQVLFIMSNFIILIRIAIS
jgi:hypothetical protein